MPVIEKTSAKVEAGKGERDEGEADGANVTVFLKEAVAEEGAEEAI